jgi:hypothetical protein
MIDRLVVLQSRGFTSREIAQKLGREFDFPFTRNSIIGKMHRLCLPPRVKPITQPKPKKVYARKRKRKGAGPGRIVMKVQQPRAESGEPVTIYQLGFGDCRYPLGNYPFVFCGKEQLEGSSYCPEHFAICHGNVQRKDDAMQMKAWA